MISINTKIIHRLLSNIVIDNETNCWKWIGELNHAGYGKIFYNGKKIKTHRFTYEWLIEPIPKGFELHHAVCNNKQCCNPNHLMIVTHNEHMQYSRKLFCKRGHSMAENSRITTRGERVCRVCEKIRSREYKYRKKNHNLSGN